MLSMSCIDNKHFFNDVVGGEFNSRGPVLRLPGPEGEPIYFFLA
jgi:hypothetical protein